MPLLSEMVVRANLLLKDMDREKEAYEFFIKKGYSPEVSAGIVGNLIHESGLSTKIEGDKGLRGGSSYGLAQWREGRLTGLQTFAKNRKSEWTDFNTQLEYVHHELNTSEKGTLNRLNKAKTPEEASDIFMRGYERPSNKAMADSGSKRAKHARNLIGGTFRQYSNYNTDDTQTNSKQIEKYDVDSTLNLKGDNSHLTNVDLPEYKEEVVQAKKDILENQIQKQDSTPQPQLEQIPQQVEQPTYNYLTNTNLFQLQ